MLLLLLLAIVISQSIVSSIWMGQIRQREMEGVVSAGRNLALSAASTVNYFKSLPLQYRNIALDQLRDMGGARFFVSLNEEKININPAKQDSYRNLVIHEVYQVLGEKLGTDMKIRVNFSRPEDLHVFNNHTLLSDLPPSWAHYTLTLDPLNPPVLVTQIEIAKNEWLYLAALMPAPYMTMQGNLLPNDQVKFIILMTIFLFLFTFVLVRKQTRPLRRLARAARALGKNIDQPPLREEGANEIVAATRAFNLMQRRLQRFIDDRERLFRSISHDLKTPITRLRLRAELLDDESQTEKFEKDLDELEFMVKSALQAVKETDIHENIESLDINQLLSQMTEVMNASEHRVNIEGKTKSNYRGKPLALKRCIGNLIDNALRYGTKLRIIIQDDMDQLTLYFIDNGPGIPDPLLEKIFEPYFRASQNIPGTGLGLGIARSIAHAHGGSLTLENRPHGGLQAILTLGRN
ncbi:ATP-binding protein [Dongshaea marina]|uniref:ATP-binding protein n=1 Tax=Dongshaea marina TaxID=2047966 RepID=UPI000D3E2133|nr:ATP-binding protein [Dongshaea marina]